VHPDGGQSRIRQFFLLVIDSDGNGLSRFDIWCRQGLLTGGMSNQSVDQSGIDRGDQVPNN
jgi:hypothetical protein